MPFPRGTDPSPIGDPLSLGEPSGTPHPGTGKQLPCREERARAAISWMVSARRDLGSISTVSSTLTCQGRQGCRSPQPPRLPAACHHHRHQTLCPGKWLSPAWCPPRGAGLSEHTRVLQTHVHLCAEGWSRPVQAGQQVHTHTHLCLCARCHCSTPIRCCSHFTLICAHTGMLGVHMPAHVTTCTHTGTRTNAHTHRALLTMRTHELTARTRVLTVHTHMKPVPACAHTHVHGPC